MMNRRVLAAACFAALACAGSLGAEPTKLDPRMVAVFKNGLGFFVRTGEASLTDGWAWTDFVPQATLGTFWMSTPAAGAWVDEVVAYTEESEKSVDVQQFEDLLRANVGRQVRITRNVEPRTIEGELAFVPEGGLTFVQVKTRLGEMMAFPAYQIVDIVVGGDMQIKKTQKETQKRIRFRVQKAPAKAPVTMAYLSKGITWMPSYLVNIEDPKRARITFQAMLVNDVEDLENVEFLFVVGYPNFQFSDTVSPIALQQQVGDLVRGISLDRPRDDYLANIMTQSVGRYDGSPRAAIPPVDAGYSSAIETPGQSEEDLFLYSKTNVTLKKGQRAAYTVFSDLVDYEHIYEWAVDDQSGVDTGGYRRDERQDGKLRDAVWHCLRLNNSTDYPWTTAPAFTVSGEKPIAQDTINYTSRTAKSSLKLTVATDVSADKREDEIDRKHEVVINRSRFDEVTVQGELSVTNYKSEPVKMSITKNLTGEVLKSGEGKVRKLAVGLASANPRSLIEWEIELAAGKTVKLAYEYKVYVRI